MLRLVGCSSQGQCVIGRRPIDQSTINIVILVQQPLTFDWPKTASKKRKYPSKPLLLSASSFLRWLLCLPLLAHKFKLIVRFFSERSSLTPTAQAERALERPRTNDKRTRDEGSTKTRCAAPLVSTGRFSH